jgi:hypothetical protein
MHNIQIKLTRIDLEKPCQLCSWKNVIQVETGIYGIKENHRLLEYDANVD